MAKPTTCSFCAKSTDGVYCAASPLNRNVSICERCIFTSADSITNNRITQPDKIFRYRYHWQATYDDGTVVDQFVDGKEQSVSVLEWPRVKKMALIPQRGGYPPITMHIGEGETAIKFWQVTHSSKFNRISEHREVLGLKLPKKGQVYLLAGVKGDLILSTSPNV